MTRGDATLARALAARPVIFVDVEASAGFGYPIQVGWAVVEGAGLENIRTGSIFIRHDPWLNELRLWDPAAEALHRITREFLKAEGMSVEQAAAWLNFSFKGQQVYTDVVDSDGWWIDQIFNVAKIPRQFHIADIAIPMTNTDEMAYEQAIRSVDKIAPKTHRADEDAYRWAVIYSLARVLPPD
jgi:hypothetical protein